MQFRISVCIKKRTTHRWGKSLSFVYIFVIMHTDFMHVYSPNSCMLQKMCNSAPWGHTFRWVAEFGVTPALLVFVWFSAARGEVRCRSWWSTRSPISGCAQRTRSVYLHTNLQASTFISSSLLGSDLHTGLPETEGCGRQSSAHREWIQCIGWSGSLGCSGGFPPHLLMKVNAMTCGVYSHDAVLSSLIFTGTTGYM